MPDVKADLSKHVIERGLDGVFLYLAKEEAAIRNDPLKRSTELLQKCLTDSNGKHGLTDATCHYLSEPREFRQVYGQLFIFES